MATPTSPEKRLFALGAAKASTWGTAVALEAGKGILYLGTSGFSPTRPTYLADEADSPVRMSGDLGAYNGVEFSIDFDMRYDPGALGVLIALLFGTAGTPTQQGGSSAYKHTLQWADTTSGLFATLAKELPGKIYEIPSAKITGLTFNIADGLLKGTIRGLGNKVIDDSTVNTPTQMDALTYADRYNRVRFVEGKFYMNTEGGAALGESDLLTINDLTLEFNRPHDSVVPAGSDSIIEPVQNGFPEFRIVIGFPRFSSQNYGFLSTFNSETTLKAKVEFTGNIIESTYNYKLTLYFPRLRIAEFTPKEEEVIANGLELIGLEAAANPAGMSYKRPYVEIVNKQSTDYLA